MKKLVKLLEENARLTHEELGAMLDLTPEQIKKEIKSLEKKGIVKGYRAIVNWDKIDDKHVTAIIELKVSPKKEFGFDEIAEKIVCFSEVESVYLMSGGYDLSVIINGKTFQDIAMFVACRLSTLDSVLSTATHFVLKRYKDRSLSFKDESLDERSTIL